MAEIRTSAFTAGDIVTTHQPPESVRDWVDRHADAVKAATPAGTTLTTEWPDTCALTTYQKEGSGSVRPWRSQRVDFRKP